MELRDYVGKPIRSLQTMLRVLSKTRNDQPSVIPDGIYGSDTITAVSAFQKNEGIPATGEADSRTWKRIQSEFSRKAPLVLPAAPLEIIWQPRYKIKAGEKNAHLYLIQAMLLAIGEVYANVPAVQVTGVHDGQSVNTVRWLQEICGKEMTGVIDQTDWLYLTKLYRTSIGDGKTDYDL